MNSEKCNGLETVIKNEKGSHVVVTAFQFIET
jgi:hypothetical protein